MGPPPLHPHFGETMREPNFKSSMVEFWVYFRGDVGVTYVRNLKIFRALTRATLILAKMCARVEFSGNRCEFSFVNRCRFVIFLA